MVLDLNGELSSPLLQIRALRRRRYLLCAFPLQVTGSVDVVGRVARRVFLDLAVGLQERVLADTRG